MSPSPAPRAVRILRAMVPLVPALLSGLAHPAEAQVVRNDVYVTNGVVNDLALSPSGSTLYLGGSFTQVGPATGGYVAVQLDSYQYYHVTATDFAGNEGAASSTLNTVTVPIPGEVPSRFALWPNRPNPFPSSTFISFDLPSAEKVVVRIFDLTGALVKTLVDATLEARKYSIVWTGEDDRGRQARPGVYFYRLDSGRFQKTGKAIKIR